MQFPPDPSLPFVPRWTTVQLPAGAASTLLADGPYLLGGWSCSTTGGTGAFSLFDGESNNGVSVANVVIDSNSGAQAACPFPGIFVERGIFYVTTQIINLGCLYVMAVNR